MYYAQSKKRGTIMKISGFYDEVSSKLDEQIALIKEFGESYICPRGVDGKNIVNYTLEEFEKSVKPRLVESGIKISSLGSPIGKIKLEDEKAFEEQKVKLAELLKIAKSMNCQYIRVFSFHLPKKGNPDKYLGAVADKLKVFVKMAQEAGITLIHENEKGIFGDSPKRCIALARTINSENFKLCYDASNYVQCGHDSKKAFEMTKQYTVYYHIKDCCEYKEEVPLGMGICDYSYIISELKKDGYDGFLTLEPHTVKYVLLRKVLFFLPVIPRMRKTYRMLDKKIGKSIFSKVTAKEVFVWQYDALKEILQNT